MIEVFLSYSRNDLAAANALRAALMQAGLEVFKDDDSIRSGDRWLHRLQGALSNCNAFVVLIGRDGVRRWVGAEVQVALIRHLSPQSDAERLPIFPLLLEDTAPEGLPPFLRLFQSTRWSAADPLPAQLIEDLRARTDRLDADELFQGCPFLGLNAFQARNARLFFGRRTETLQALACLGDQQQGNPEQCSQASGAQYHRWLQIEGNSGAGKSSLVQAGMLPMIEYGALWARTGFEHWTVIGPMMPGSDPLATLAEKLAQAFAGEMGEIRSHLEVPGDAPLSDWLRTRKREDRAFLLVIDQFEELFTFAETKPPNRFDALVAHALQEPECPLFVISTVRSDFLDRFGLLPCLQAIYNSHCRRYFLPTISAAGLREVIEQRARMTELNVDEVLIPLLDQARGEDGALPLVENALSVLWDKKAGNKLPGQYFHDAGGLAGMLSSQADNLLARIERDLGAKGRAAALELLLRLTRINDDGRHTRQRINREEAVMVAGAGDDRFGERVLQMLSGVRRTDQPAAAGTGALRLVTAIDEADGKYVDLIHETLIRPRIKDPTTGRRVGFWPALYDYISANRNRDLYRQQLRLQAEHWRDSAPLGRWSALAGWRDIGRFRKLTLARHSLERRYLLWSQAVGALELGILAAIAVTSSTLILQQMTIADERLAVGLRVVDRTTVLDFSGWKEVSVQDYLSRNQENRSLVVSRNWFRVKRTRKEPSHFIHIYGTRSNTAPFFSCSPIACNSKADSSSANGVKQYVLSFDLSTLQIGETADIKFEVTFVNGFQCETEVGGVRMLHDTERALFKIVYPEKNRPRPEDLQRIFRENKEEGQPPDTDVYNVNLSDELVSEVNWTLLRPITDRVYMARWKWNVAQDWRNSCLCKR